MSNSFTLEGLELRIKQKIVQEESPQSNAFEVDYTKNAKIIGFEDGKLYFQDNEITEPIPLTKIDKFFEHIVTDENGELIFYTSDFEKFVTLSQLTSEVSQISKKNALLYSNMKRYSADASFKSYDFMDAEYKKFGDTLTENLRQQIELIDFSGVASIFNSAYTNVYISELIQYFTYGLGSIATTPLTPSEFTNSVVLRDKGFIMNNTAIGFAPTVDDLIGRVYFAGKPLVDFDQYVFKNLYAVSDAGRHIYGKVGNLSFGTELDKYRSVIMNEAVKAVSSIVITRLVRSINDALGDAGYINPDTENFREVDEISSIDFQAILATANAEFVSLTSTIASEAAARVEVAMDNVQSNILNLADFSEVNLGAKFTPDDIYASDFSVFNKVWFDVPGFYAATNKIGEDMGISVIASLNVDIQHSQSVTYEFRLFDSVSQVELDRVRLDSIEYDPNRFLGNIFEPRTETIPIQLNYFGPIPSVECTARAYQECFSNLDVKSYPRINPSDILTKALSDEFRIISDRVEALDPVVGKDEGIVSLHTPRVIRVQWRIVTDEEKEFLTPHKDAVANISFNKYAPNSDDQDISINVYNFGGARDRKIIQQGVVQFLDFDEARVEGNFSNNSGEEYSINLAADKNVQLWYTDKDKNGFTIKTNKEFQGEVSWTVTAQSSFTDETREQGTTELPDCLVDYQPEYSSISNFDIFLQEGYQVNLVPETLAEEITGETDISLPEPDEVVDAGFQVDLLGAECSTDCINDCPEGFECSGACPGAELTESGCACCECFDDTQCPEGMICDGLGNCI